jgi:hypothetical protein
MSFIVSTYMFRSLVWPSSECSTVQISRVQQRPYKMRIQFPKTLFVIEAIETLFVLSNILSHLKRKEPNTQWRKVTCKKNCTLTCCLMYLAPQRYGFHMRGICPPGSAPEEGIPYFVFKHIQGGAKITDTIDMLNSESRVASGTLYINPASILSV